MFPEVEPCLAAETCILNDMTESEAISCNKDLRPSPWILNGYARGGGTREPAPHNSRARLISESPDESAVPVKR